MLALKPALALQAPRGGGKTWLADWLEQVFARDPAALTADLVRNPEGDVIAQTWALGALQVLRNPDAAAITTAAPATLLLFDGVPEDEALLTRALDWGKANPQGRVLLLLTPDRLEQSRLPAGFVTNRLLDLPKAACLARAPTLALEDWTHAGQFALSRAAGHPVDLSHYTASAENPPAWLADEVQAATLETASLAEIAILLPTLPDAVLRRVFARIGTDPAASGKLLAAVLEGDAPLWQLLAAEGLAASRSDLAATLARRICTGITGAPPALRLRAGQALSRLGDPRDLEAMVPVPAGRYAFGGPSISGASLPSYTADLPAFAIAAYPVTVAAYGAFFTATGRAWASPAKDDPARRNQPATDLTWHDARAYCAWATDLWRADGRIAPDQTLRLPTEREWEAAARGAAGLPYPWGETWQPEHCNGEETGFNDVCAVGLFPEGASPCGAHDMACNIWEWCLTLWGPDMAAPTFANPWADDGREALDAPATIRRILRGGSFVSPGEKTNAVYRGSLEPQGAWRGNGFRMVLA